MNRYEAYIEQHHKGEGRVEISECLICGFLQWGSTIRDGSGYFVSELHSCPKCVEAIQRAPELAVWVTNVVNQAIRKHG